MREDASEQGVGECGGGGRSERERDGAGEGSVDKWGFDTGSCLFYFDQREIDD